MVEKSNKVEFSRQPLLIGSAQTASSIGQQQSFIDLDESSPFTLMRALIV